MQLACLASRRELCQVLVLCNTSYWRLSYKCPERRKITFKTICPRKYPLSFSFFFFHSFSSSFFLHTKVNKTKWNCAFGIRAPLALIKIRVIFCADTIFSVTIFSLVCSPIAKWDVTVLYDCTYIWKFHSRLRDCAPALLSRIHFSWVLWNQI